MKTGVTKVQLQRDNARLSNELQKRKAEAQQKDKRMHQILMGAVDCGVLWHAFAPAHRDWMLHNLDQTCNGSTASRSGTSTQSDVRPANVVFAALVVIRCVRSHNTQHFGKEWAS